MNRLLNITPIGHPTGKKAKTESTTKRESVLKERKS